MQVSINPATGAELARLDDHDPAAVDAALDAAVAAQRARHRTLVTARV